MHKKTSYTHCENFYCLMIEMSLKKDNVYNVIKLNGFSFFLSLQILEIDNKRLS